MTSLITAAEAAKFLDLSPRQVQRLSYEDGPLEAVRRDPVILIPVERVEALKAAREAAK